MTAITAPFAARFESKTGRRAAPADRRRRRRPPVPPVPGPGNAAARRGLSVLRHAQRCPRLDRGEPQLDLHLRRHPHGHRRARRRHRGVARRSRLAGRHRPGRWTRAHLRRLAPRAPGRARLRGHRRPGAVGVGDGDAGPDAGRRAHRAAHRDPARDRRRSQPALRVRGRADPRRDADHADDGLPRADDAALRHRHPARHDRDPHLRHPARHPHHGPRHPGRAEDDDGGRRIARARPAGRRCPRSSCRSLVGPSASGSTRRS